MPVAEPQSATAEPAPQKISETIGAIFGDPTKTEFTPAEIVAGTVKLTGVAGAIVALQEGLPVATSLPEGDARAMSSPHSSRRFSPG